MPEDKKLNPTRDVLHDRNVISLLEKLGLSRNEAKCYLSSLTLGSATVSEVAKAAHVNRVNAYDAIARLAHKNLLDKEVRKGKQYVAVTPLERLQEFAVKQQKQATKLRWRIEDLIPTLLTFAANAHGQARVGFKGVIIFRGEDAVERIAERSLLGAPGTVNYFVETSEILHPPQSSHYDEQVYIPARLRRGIYAKSLHRPNKYGKRLRVFDKKEMRETRFLPQGAELPCGIWIYGTEVAFLWQAEETIALAITKSPIVTAMRLLFELAWEISGKVRSRTKNKTKSNK